MEKQEGCFVMVFPWAMREHQEAGAIRGVGTGCLWR